MQLDFDDSKLTEALRELEPKRIRQALKGGLSRSATQVRRKAIANLRAQLKSDPALEKGIRKGVNRDAGGFYVTIGGRGETRRNKGKRNGRKRYGKTRTGWTSMSMTENSRGQRKPILPWMELGTRQRHTKIRTDRRGRRRGSHRTGRIEPRLFMDKTERECRPGVIAGIRENFDKNLRRIIKKYGR